MERKLINRHGPMITFEYVEKWKSHLMRPTFEDGGMHLLFIMDIEEDIEMLTSEEYIEVKE